ncbi:MAG: hypothetical protein ACK4J2_08830, partial [Sulfurihydrogenibium azorense]|uniref:hypothetical protein n=1 Tax=Sulfurihydrogenibium azorense TaxID=309806 RepID=UPI0039198CCC
MKKLINIDLVPNFEDDDFEIIEKLLSNHSFDFENSEKNVKKILSSYFPNSEIYFFNSARSALTFLLTKTTADKASILTQAFSCLVV